MEINTNFCIFFILNPIDKSLFLDFKSPVLLANECFSKNNNIDVFIMKFLVKIQLPIIMYINILITIHI